MPDPSRVLEIYGEGPTDVGRSGASRTEPERPTQGVVPILVHKLCAEPSTMMVVRRAFPYLQGKGLRQKVIFVKRNPSHKNRAGAIFVLDSEGDHPHKLDELVSGRDSANPDLPMAVGVAHPCIETWLLADAAAIASAFGLSSPPNVPQDPESLPAPWKNPSHDPKTVLGRFAGQSNVSSRDAWRIAQLANTDTVRQRCPKGFGAFAKEVEERIAPLFRQVEE
jgi:hypothetical protein